MLYTEWAYMPVLVHRMGLGAGLLPYRVGLGLFHAEWAWACSTHSGPELCLLVLHTECPLACSTQGRPVPITHRAGQMSNLLGRQGSSVGWSVRTFIWRSWVQDPLQQLGPHFSFVRNKYRSYLALKLATEYCIPGWKVGSVRCKRQSPTTVHPRARYVL